MTTKIPVELSSTPGIVDGSNATAITIDSSERVGFGITSPSDNIHILGNDSTPNAGITIQTDDTASAQAGITLMSRNSANTNVTATLKNVTTALQSSLGITFGSDTAAANALDDYEEGSWTPTIIGDGGASGQSYSIQYGAYTRIGNFVHMTFDVRLTALGTLSGTYVHIGGHGFTFKGNNIGGSALIGYVANVSNSNHYPLNAYLHATGVYLMQGGNGYITTAAAGGNFINSNTILIGTITGLLA